MKVFSLCRLIFPFDFHFPNLLLPGLFHLLTAFWMSLCLLCLHSFPHLESPHKSKSYPFFKFHFNWPFCPEAFLNRSSLSHKAQHMK